MRWPSMQSLSKANPRCLSAFHPKAETIFRILAGREDSKMCTDPMLVNNSAISWGLFFSASNRQYLPELNSRNRVLVHVPVELLAHPLVFLPYQTVAVVC